MLQSFFEDGLMALSVWVALSMVTVLLWGILAWTVVSIISRRDTRYGSDRHR
jgi:hypothetical protein